MPPASPHVTGADGAGVVEAVGVDVTAVRPGDRVVVNPGISCRTCAYCRAGEHSLCTTFRLLGEHLGGTFTEAIRLPEENVAVIPASVPWPEAAAFPLTFLTAWRMVATRAAVRAGETVLIWGIGGGVALAALQIAKLRGATVVVTSSSDEKLARARALGADVALNHAGADVAREVRELTGKRGADVVIDTVGEATWDRSLRALARGGRLVTCGATTGPSVGLDVRRLFWHQHTVMGSTMGNAGEFRDVVGLLAQGVLHPVVDAVFPVRRAPRSSAAGVGTAVRQARAGHRGLGRRGIVVEFFDRLKAGLVQLAQLLPPLFFALVILVAGFVVARMAEKLADAFLGTCSLARPSGGACREAVERIGERIAPDPRRREAALLAGDAGRHPPRLVGARRPERQRYLSRTSSGILPPCSRRSS